MNWCAHLLHSSIPLLLQCVALTLLKRWIYYLSRSPSTVSCRPAMASLLAGPMGLTNKHFAASNSGIPKLRGQGQGWVLLDSPACRGVLLDSTPCRASRGTSECYASGVGPTVTRDTRGESSRTQPWPWPLNLCQIVPHHQSPRKTSFCRRRRTESCVKKKSLLLCSCRNGASLLLVELRWGACCTNFCKLWIFE